LSDAHFAEPEKSYHDPSSLISLVEACFARTSEPGSGDPTKFLAKSDCQGKLARSTVGVVVTILRRLSMATYSNELEAELEQELHEGSLETEGEAGLEGEGILGALGGLFGEGEGEAELHELHEIEGEGEWEGEMESGEQFFGKAFRSIGNFVKKNSGLLKSIAKVAAPMVGTAIGGPFGAVLGKLATSALGEGELEQELEAHELHEFESEGELEWEAESETHESSHEAAHEIAHHEVTQHEALAEMMAEAAAHELHEGEAEAMAGASTVTVISPADRRALRRILPHLVRGTAILTRILRRRRATRPAVRAVPTIVRRTVKTLKRHAAAGRPITRQLAGRTAAAQVRNVLGNPKACTAAIAGNLRSSRAIRGRSSVRPVAG
jgi:hypothetical protein